MMLARLTVLAALAAVAASPAVALATPGSALAEPAPFAIEGTLIVRPDGLPDRIYAGDIFTTGGSTGHLLIRESSNPQRPARWSRIDDHGMVAWEADFACPNFVDLAVLPAMPKEAKGAEIAVCKVGRTIVGVDVTTGREAWTFSETRPLYVTVRAGDRLAVSIDNEQVAVLDAVTGKEIQRIVVDGAVLEAAAMTAKGPLAFLVKDSKQSTNEYIELPVGEGHALEKVPVTGADPGRQLMAIALGGTAKKGLTRPKVVWSVPFGGWSFDIEPTVGVVVGEPSDGRITAYDALDGHVLWERPEPEGEKRAWGNDGGVAARVLAGGGIRLTASDAKLGKVLWDRVIEVDGEPLAVGADDGDVGLVWAAGFELADFQTGRTKLARTFAPGEQIVALRSTPGSVLWVVGKDGQRVVHFERLPPD